MKRFRLVSKFKITDGYVNILKQYMLITIGVFSPSNKKNS